MGADLSFFLRVKTITEPPNDMSCQYRNYAQSFSRHRQQPFTEAFLIIISARQHICYSALYAIARPSVCLSVGPSVTRVDQSKTFEVRITQPSPHSSPMTLVS